MSICYALKDLSMKVFILPHLVQLAKKCSGCPFGPKLVRFAGVEEVVEVAGERIIHHDEFLTVRVRTHIDAFLNRSKFFNAVLGV